MAKKTRDTSSSEIGTPESVGAEDTAEVVAPESVGAFVLPTLAEMQTAFKRMYPNSELFREVDAVACIEYCAANRASAEEAIAYWSRHADHQKPLRPSSSVVLPDDAA